MLVLGLGVECKVEKAYRKKKREIGCRVSFLFSTEMGWARESYCRKNSFGQIMELTAISFATTLVALLISSPAIAQTPPVPILPPSPAPAPHHVNLTELLSVAGPYHTFLNYLLQTRVIDTFQNQANNSEQGITIFVPKDSAFALLKSSDLANLTDDQLRTLLLYHAFPKYYSLSDFRNLSNMNPVTTFAGGQYTLNVTEIAGIIHVVSSWSRPKISSSVYSTAPIAVYQIGRVLLPEAIFSVDPPLAPAPAPAPETTKASDLAPSRNGIASSPKSLESPTTTGGSSYNTMVGLLSYFILAVSSGLMLL
ncbi:hypothetical protein BHM03_00048418 [Ensete ventricosum]|nr:hypothetical protein BHM03_00048418 [Ensete ventricosum]